MSRPGRTCFRGAGAAFTTPGRRPRLRARDVGLPELRRAGTPLLPARAREGGARAGLGSLRMARRGALPAERLDRAARRRRDRRARPRPRRRARDGAPARGAAPRGLPAARARAAPRGVGLRARGRARLPARARAPGRALGRRRLRARLLVPRPPPRASGRAEPSGRSARARLRYRRGGGEPERAPLPHGRRHRLPLRPRRRRGAPVPARSAPRRREPDRELGLGLQRAAQPPARPRPAPLRALPARRPGRGAGGPPPVRPDPALPLRRREALDLLPQRLLPLGAAPRERAALHRRGARAPRPLRGDRRVAGDPPRHALRAGRRAAALEPPGDPCAHRLRGPPGPGAPAPPAAPLALLQLKRSTPRAIPAR